MEKDLQILKEIIFKYDAMVGRLCVNKSCEHDTVEESTRMRIRASQILDKYLDFRNHQEW